MSSSEVLKQEKNLEVEYPKISHFLKTSWESVQEFSVWTKLGTAATVAELAFSTNPIIAIPAIYIDVGSGLGNVFQKIDNNNLVISDLLNLGSSLTSFAGGYAILASNGIEMTVLGLRLANFAKVTTPVGLALVGIGLAIDNYPLIKTKFNGLKSEFQLDSFLSFKNVEIPNKSLENQHVHSNTCPDGKHHVKEHMVHYPPSISHPAGLVAPRVDHCAKNPERKL